MCSGLGALLAPGIPDERGPYCTNLGVPLVDRPEICVLILQIVPVSSNSCVGHGHGSIDTCLQFAWFNPTDRLPI